MIATPPPPVTNASLARKSRRHHHHLQRITGQHHTVQADRQTEGGLSILIFSIDDTILGFGNCAGLCRRSTCCRAPCDTTNNLAKQQRAHQIARHQSIEEIVWPSDYSAQVLVCCHVLDCTTPYILFVDCINNAMLLCRAEQPSDI